VRKWLAALAALILLAGALARLLEASGQSDRFGRYIGQ